MKRFQIVGLALFLIGFIPYLLVEYLYLQLFFMAIWILGGALLVAGVSRKNRFSAVAVYLAAVALFTAVMLFP